MDFSFSEWRDSLSIIQQIYWGFAIPSTLIFIIQTLITFFGAVFEVMTDLGAGFSFLSFQT